MRALLLLTFIWALVLVLSSTSAEDINSDQLELVRAKRQFGGGGFGRGGFGGGGFGRGGFGGGGFGRGGFGGGGFGRGGFGGGGFGGRGFGRYG